MCLSKRLSDIKVWREAGFGFCFLGHFFLTHGCTIRHNPNKAKAKSASSKSPNPISGRLKIFKVKVVAVNVLVPSYLYATDTVYFPGNKSLFSTLIGNV